MNYLEYLVNWLGDCEITQMGVYKGEPFCSKWLSFFYCAEKEPWRVSKANNRTIYDVEVVLDVDEPEQIGKVQRLLDKHRLRYRLYNSNKGYHAHLIFPELRGYTTIQRTYLKGQIIEYFGTDIMKKSPRTTIAMEYSPHWKSGRIKKLIKEVKGVNSLRTLHAIL